jgi:spore germination cell wall hydrolase CwlJ-like protein
MIKLKEIVKEIMDAPPIIQQHQITQPTNVMNQKSINDSYILATTIWGEARGEGEKGMQAVLNVILNRAGGDFNKATQISIQPKQFSFWNKISNKQEYSNKIAQSAREGKFKDSKQYIQALTLVDKALKHQLQDITGGAKFYFNPKLVRPAWANKMIKTSTIGNHDFYKLPVSVKSD